MSQFKLKWFYRVLLIVLLLSLVVSPAAAEDPTPPEKSLGGADPNAIFIYLVYDSFDPLLRQPEMTKQLAFSAQEAASDGAYLVQFSGPVQESWVQALEELGAQVGPYIPDYTFIVHLDAVSKAKVESLSFVRWVGVFEPAYRIAPKAWELKANSYLVQLLPWADTAALKGDLAQAGQAAAARLEAAPQAVEQYAANGLSVTLDAAGVQQAARLPGVLWVEPMTLKELYNDKGGEIMNAGVAWASSLNGSGITVGVADTGLDIYHGDFTGRLSNSKSYPVVAATYGACVISNAGADDLILEKWSGHGTHVMGSVTGSGARSGGTFKGLAYGAAFTIQAVEQWTTFTGGCSSGYYLTGVPADASVLLEEAYAWGVRVHSNSWGSAEDGKYDSTAASFDQRLYAHKDMLVTVSAGNDGKDADKNGYVDLDSMGSPATAKNALTVGASDSVRTSGGISGYTWYDFQYSDFPANPTKIDYVSDNSLEMAAFSSRGPTDDGRIKPDVVAPGTNIISTRASTAPGTGWGIYDTYYMYNGGTSMAAPLVAGAAALVREYYIEKMGILNPSAALVKATLINTAVDITGYNNTSQEAGQPIPNMHEGWGRVDVGAAVTTSYRQVTDSAAGVAAGGAQQYAYTVSAGKPFKVSLVWTDKEAAALASVTLINNLDLEVVAPDGTTIYRGNVFSGGWSQTGGVADTRNNVENIYIQSPISGQWLVKVKGTNVPYGPQPFALVVDGYVNQPTPYVNSISPNRALNNATLTGAVINGDNLLGATNVKLIKGAVTLTGSITGSTQTQVTANFPLSGAASGWYDLTVTTPIGDASKTSAFYVLDASLPDLQIALNTVGTPFSSGEPVTFTVRVENAGLVAATGVVFTQTVPAEIGSLAVTPSCGTYTPLIDGYRCAIGSLALGASAVYTVTGQAAVDSRGLFSSEAIVDSTQADRWEADNTDEAWFIIDEMDIFLPLILNISPLTPDAPVLQAISNAAEIGSYTLSWTAPTGNPVTGYDIEENGSVLVSGVTATSYAISSKAPGYYSYRVRAYNSYGKGVWSNAQTSLVNPLLNWNFELGDNGNWTWSSVLGVSPVSGPPPSCYPPDCDPATIFTAHSGSWITWLGGADSSGNNDVDSWVQQSVTIPSGAVQINYWYWILATDNCGSLYDNVEIKLGDTVIGSHQLCSSTNMSGWAQATIAIGALGGQTRTLQFHMTQDVDYTSNFLLDDVEIK